MVWTWYFLAAYPKVQKKAQEEIDNVLGNYSLFIGLLTQRQSGDRFDYTGWNKNVHCDYRYRLLGANKEYVVITG